MNVVYCENKLKRYLANAIVNNMISKAYDVQDSIKFGSVTLDTLPKKYTEEEMCKMTGSNSAMLAYGIKEVCAYCNVESATLIVKLSSGSSGDYRKLCVVDYTGQKKYVDYDAVEVAKIDGKFIVYNYIETKEPMCLEEYLNKKCSDNNCSYNDLRIDIGHTVSSNMFAVNNGCILELLSVLTSRHCIKGASYNVYVAREENESYRFIGCDDLEIGKEFSSNVGISNNIDVDVLNKVYRYVARRITNYLLECVSYLLGKSPVMWGIHLSRALSLETVYWLVGVDYDFVREKSWEDS